MSAQDPKFLTAGFNIVDHGVSDGIAPKRVAPNQFARAVNMTFRKGIPRTRPPIRAVALTYPDAPTQTAFETGLFQGAHPYAWANMRFIMVSISGRLFQIDPVSFSVTEVTIPGDPNGSFLTHTWTEQAEMFWILQDGLSLPLIFDGTIVRRSKGLFKQEVPVGSIMRFSGLRLWVCDPLRRSFIASDVSGSLASGTKAYGYKDSVLKFTDNTFILGGASFSVDGQEITAMKEIASIDSALNQGPLQVFTANGAYSVNAPLDATLWLAMRSPLKTGSLLSRGAMSQRSTVQVNNDIWFRARDGIRSFQVARRESNTWTNTSMSREMDNILSFDQSDLLDMSSAVLFDNRLLTTCSPYYTSQGVVHRGLVALDFFETTSLQAGSAVWFGSMRWAPKNDPDYDGLWIGLKILQILTMEINGVERCFALALNPSNRIKLYELLKTGVHDGDGTQRIWGFFETPAYFGIEPPEGKVYKAVVESPIHYSNIVGQVDFVASYRADNATLWNSWQSWSDCAENTCTWTSCAVPTSPADQYRAPIYLPKPSDDCDAQTNRPFRWGYSFQVRVEFTGNVQFDFLRLNTIPQAEPKFSGCPTSSPACPTLTGCPEKIFNHQIA